MDALREAGTDAVPASTFFELSIDPPKREEVRALVEREPFDAVMVARIAPRGTEYRTATVPADAIFGPSLGFYDYYWRAWPHVYASSTRAVRLGALEVRLYDVHGDGRLAFRATSDEFAVARARDALGTISEEVAKRLAGAGLLSSQR